MNTEGIYRLTNSRGEHKGWHMQVRIGRVKFTKKFSFKRYGDNAKQICINSRKQVEDILYRSCTVDGTLSQTAQTKIKNKLKQIEKQYVTSK